MIVLAMRTLPGIALLLATAACATEEPAASRPRFDRQGLSLGARIDDQYREWGRGAVLGPRAGAVQGFVVAVSSRKRFSRPDRLYDPDSEEMRWTRGAPPEETPRRADAAAWFRRGVWSQDEAEARQCFRTSLRLHPSPPAWNNLGVLLVAKGDRDGARHAFSRALAIAPGYVPARHNLQRLTFR